MERDRIWESAVNGGKVGGGGGGGKDVNCKTVPSVEHTPQISRATTSTPMDPQPAPHLHHHRHHHQSSHHRHETPSTPILKVPAVEPPTPIFKPVPLSLKGW